VKTQSRSTRSGIWVSSLALQAVSRNTDLILACSNGDHPAAGPGTAQYFYETAAGAVSGVVCGGHSWGGTRKFKIGQTLDYGSPVESQFLGDICQASVGMDTGHANRIVLELLSRYEKSVGADAPEGEILHRLYELSTGEAKPHYRKIYDGVAAELRSMGVSMENYEGPTV
jgi:methylamine--corrinoid protein Co-methyltransferase